MRLTAKGQQRVSVLRVANPEHETDLEWQPTAVVSASKSPGSDGREADDSDGQEDDETVEEGE